jgi:hypothetical protein
MCWRRGTLGWVWNWDSLWEKLPIWLASGRPRTRIYLNSFYSTEISLQLFNFIKISLFQSSGTRSKAVCFILMRAFFWKIQIERQKWPNLGRMPGRVPVFIEVVSKRLRSFSYNLHSQTYSQVMSAIPYSFYPFSRSASIFVASEQSLWLFSGWSPHVGLSPYKSL